MGRGRSVEWQGEERKFNKCHKLYTTQYRMLYTAPLRFRMWLRNPLWEIACEWTLVVLSSSSEWPECTDGWTDTQGSRGGRVRQRGWWGCNIGERERGKKTEEREWAKIDGGREGSEVKNKKRSGLILRSGGKWLNHRMGYEWRMTWRRNGMRLGQRKKERDWTELKWSEEEVL